MMTRKNKRLAIASMTLFCFVAPAAAQFEVSPDHFNEPSMPAVAKANPQQQETEVRIAEQQRILESYQAQIKAKLESVEEAREEAVSAGILGDGAGNYIEAYRGQQKELELLPESLRPKMELAWNTIASLQARLPVVAAKTQAPRPFHRPKRKATMLLATAGRVR